MTDLDLDAIKARTEAVPEGPWTADDTEIYVHRSWEWIAESLHTGRPERGQAIAEFIAAARTDVPALVAEVERLREWLVSDGYRVDD